MVTRTAKQQFKQFFFTTLSRSKQKKKVTAKSGRKKGGQLGHKGWKRSIIPPEKVDAIVDCKPADTCECGGKVRLKDKIQIHQVYEIPLPKYEVTEYRIYKGCCETCHITHKGQLPTGVSWKGFGVRAQAMLSLLTSKYRLSKRLIQSWFQDVYQMPICLGSVSNVERTVSQSLKLIHEEVFSAVQAEKIIHVDETGHKECNRSGWAWIASTPQYTYFMVNKSRGKKVAKEIIGDHQGRMIITDRYSSYNYLPSENHQICWAHLKRDFQKIAERPDKPRRIGNNLLKCYRLLFGFWKTAYKQGTELCKKQAKRLRRFKNKMLRWLVIGTECGHNRTARTCENILKFQHSLWHFFDNHHISPTNNHAERQLRPLVISKKLTFGTQSNSGSRFIERIFTVVTSCKQQGRDVLTFVIEAIQNTFSGKKAPSLVVN